MAVVALVGRVALVTVLTLLTPVTPVTLVAPVAPVALYTGSSSYSYTSYLYTFFFGIFKSEFCTVVRCLFSTMVSMGRFGLLS